MYIQELVADALSTANYKRYFPPKMKTVTSKLLQSMVALHMDTFGAQPYDEDSLADVVVEAVRSYTSSKQTAIEISRCFIHFLKGKYNLTLDIIFPPIDISNSFERLMYLAKELQVADRSVDDLSDILWTSTRTIEKDLARLRGEDPIQVCGIPFVVHDVTRRRGSFDFASTVHPLFLTLNLTQVMSTLQGLKTLSNDMLMANYANTTAQMIWRQLSSYAKQRILYVTSALMGEDAAWYQALEQEVTQSFWTELQCSNTYGAGVLLDCMKNGRICIIEYAMEDGTSVFYENCRVLRYFGDHKPIEISQDGTVMQLDLLRVLRSAYTKEMLI